MGWLLKTAALYFFGSHLLCTSFSPLNSYRIHWRYS